MRPVDLRFPISQPFGSMKTAGVVGDINASQDTVEYYVGRYGDYQPAGHAGCDIACPEGTPVYAMAAGTVLWADWGTNLPGDDSWSPSGYFRRWALYKGFPGIVTVIQHDGWIGVYAHLSAATLNPGDRVREGQQIGLSGGTGGVAPHLHVEALIDLNYTTGGGLIYGRTNPVPYFGAAAISVQDSDIHELKEWYDMPIGKEDLLAIAAAVNNEEMREKIAGAAAYKVLNAPILSTDKKKWPLSAHIQGNTARTVEALAQIAALTELVGQVAKAQGTNIDYAKVEAAATAGAAKAVAEAQAIDAAAIADAVVDEQASRLAQ